MTKTFDEQFSALVDGELADADCEHVLNRLNEDPELKKRWQRYYIIRDAMRSNLPETVNPHSHLSISRILETEPTLLVPSSSPKIITPLLRKASGIAIAASVAVATVLSVQMFNTKPQSSPQLAEMPDSSEYVRLAPDTASANTKALINPAPVNSVKYHPQLNKYLVDHNQTVIGSQVQGVMPYARIVVSPIEHNSQANQ